MKKQMSFQIKVPKARNHRALFDHELPFRPKVEKNVKEYRRNPKHRNKGDF